MGGAVHAVALRWQSEGGYGEGEEEQGQGKRLFGHFRTPLERDGDAPVSIKEVPHLPETAPEPVSHRAARRFALRGGGSTAFKYCPV
jgi:hypothetical protein